MELPKIISLHDHAALQALRVKVKQSHKVGIVPFYHDENDIKFVLYAPVPQREGQHGKILPYQIARGTMQAQYEVNGELLWYDKGRHLTPKRAVWKQDEPYYHTALREAQEELGLHKEKVNQLYDCGWVPYQNPKGNIYGIYMFLAHINNAHVLDFPDPYACAARLDGVGYNTLAEMVELPPAESFGDARPFKKSYLAMLKVFENLIKSRKKPPIMEVSKLE